MVIYAVKKKDKILINTIAQWRRATIVAYLIEDMHQRIYCNDTDKSVEDLWKAYADGAELIEVSVSEKTSRRSEKSHSEIIEDSISRMIGETKLGTEDVQS